MRNIRVNIEVDCRTKAFNDDREFMEVLRLYMTQLMTRTGCQPADGDHLMDSGGNVIGQVSVKVLGE